ncbi:MAG: FlgB family protein [Pseudomonadota bacterium]
MITDLKIFDVYGAMARHAAERQRVSATNIANADSPGYRAIEVEPFDAYLGRQANMGAADLSAGTFRLQGTNAVASPNGNTVTLEEAIFESAQASGQHAMALTVYTKSLDLLRAAMGKSR